MGTTYGAEELGLCSHGLACPGRRLGPLHRVLPRKLPYLDKIKIKKAVKNILRGSKLCPMITTVDLKK
jgi:hypothetical protein